MTKFKKCAMGCGTILTKKNTMRLGLYCEEGDNREERKAIKYKICRLCYDLINPENPLETDATNPAQLIDGTKATKENEDRMARLLTRNRRKMYG